MSNKIFNLVSITPHTFSIENLESRNFEKLTNLLINLSINGCLINFCLKWKEVLNKYCTEYTPYEQDEIRSCLDILESRNRIIVNEDDSINCNNEIELMAKIHEFHKIKEFNLLLGIKEYPNFKILSEIKGSNFNYQGALINKQTENKLEVLFSNILHYAGIVKIIDPYFDFGEKRYENLINIICKNTSIRHNKKIPVNIEIHTSSKKEISQDLLEVWKNKLSLLKNDVEHNVVVKIWKENDYDKWHDRFLITDQCALAMGKGLDIDDKTDSTWSLVKFDEINKIESKYVQNSPSSYKLIAEVLKNEIKIEDSSEIKETKMKEVKTEEEIIKSLSNVKSFKRTNIPQKKNL